MIAAREKPANHNISTITSLHPIPWRYQEMSSAWLLLQPQLGTQLLTRIPGRQLPTECRILNTCHFQFTNIKVCVYEQSDHITPGSSR